MSEEKALDIKSEKGLEITKDDATGRPLGLENFQPTSQFGYLKIDHEDGKIEYTLTGEKKKSWKVVVTNFSYSRVMFEPGFGNPEPLCKTKERKQNRLDLEGTVYGLCSSCEYSQWTDGKRPPCGEQLNLSVLVDGNVLTPGGVTCKGASYKTGNQLLTEFAKAGANPWSMIMEVTTEGPFKSGTVSYYKLKFNKVGKTPDDLYSIITAEYLNSGGMPVFGGDEPVAEEVSAEPEGKVVTAEEAEDILLKDDEDEKEPF